MRDGQRRPVPMIRGISTPPFCRLGTSGQRQAQEEPQPFQPLAFHPFQPLLQPQPQEEPQSFCQEPQPVLQPFWQAPQPFWQPEPQPF